MRVVPTRCVRAGSAARSTLRTLRESGLPVCGGTLTVHPRLPVGAGLGSSSADVIAAIRAVAAAHAAHLSAEQISRIAVACEGATDPLAHLPRAVLFAQRDGEVLQELGDPPRLAVLSCVTGGGAPVQTHRCDLPDAALAPQYDALLADLADALRCRDVGALGAVASASARLNQERLPRVELDHLLGCCARHGGVGVQVAHSGAVAGVLFDADRSGWDATRHRVRACAGALDGLGVRVRGLLPVVA